MLKEKFQKAFLSTTSFKGLITTRVNSCIRTGLSRINHLNGFVNQWTLIDSIGHYRRASGNIEGQESEILKRAIFLNLLRSFYSVYTLSRINAKFTSKQRGQFGIFQKRAGVLPGPLLQMGTFFVEKSATDNSKYYFHKIH